MDLNDLLNLLNDKQAMASTAIVDVRTHEERASCFLENTLHIPLNEILFSKDVLQNYKKVVFLCAHGFRAKKAFTAFESLGFTNIDYVDGNIEEWSAYSLPVVTYNERISN